MSSTKCSDSDPAQGARRATAAESESDRGGKGRWLARRKMSVVLHVLRGADLDSTSRKHWVTAATLSEWREAFLAAGEEGLKIRQEDFVAPHRPQRQLAPGCISELRVTRVDRTHRAERQPPALPRRLQGRDALSPTAFSNLLQEGTLMGSCKTFSLLNAALGAVHPVNLDEHRGLELSPRQVPYCPLTEATGLRELPGASGTLDLPVAPLVSHPQPQHLGLLINLVPAHLMARPPQNLGELPVGWQPPGPLSSSELKTFPALPQIPAQSQKPSTLAERLARVTLSGALGAVAVFVFLFPVLTAAQETPKVEAITGYSYLGLSQQPRLRFESGALNGWKASLKFNLTHQIGLLADFSGNYGQMQLKPNGLTRTSVFRRQHAYMFGTEMLVLQSSRVKLNARALLGVAHTNNTALPQGYLPIADNAFAVAFGASVDYRITDRLSYRILEPEVFVTRSGSSATNSWQQYNVRLSSGIVFTSGKISTSGANSGRVSFGVVGGAALTDAFGHEADGLMLLPGGGTQPTRLRSYSALKDYVIGPVVGVDMLWRGLSLEIGALYRPMNLTMVGVLPDGSFHSVSPATVVTWEFPVLAKYRLGSSSAKPFIELGPSFRASGNLNGSSPSPIGLTAGFGIETRFLGLRIAPLLRYTHWGADPDYTASRTKRNQVVALFSVYF